MLIQAWLVLVMAWASAGGATVSGTADQPIPPGITLVGVLGTGLQTGSVSNGSHTLSAGLVYRPLVHISEADFNGDGVVNFSDFLRFAVGFGRRQSDPAYNPRLDLNHDAEIGFSDFLIFAAAFTG
jgi:hypothetical protein